MATKSKKSEVAEAPAEAPEGVQISDIAVAVGVIDLAFQAGIILGGNAELVGSVRNRLAQHVPVAEPEAEEAEESVE